METNVAVRAPDVSGEGPIWTNPRLRGYVPNTIDIWSVIREAINRLNLVLT